MDLTKLSDADLMALKSGDLSKLSDAGLMSLKATAKPVRSGGFDLATARPVSAGGFDLATAKPVVEPERNGFAQGLGNLAAGTLQALAGAGASITLVTSGYEAT